MIKKLITPILILAAWLTLVASILCYISRYISPETCGWLPFFGLFYPIWLGLQLGLGAWCLKYKKRLFLYLFVIFLLGWGHFSSIFQWKSHAEARTSVKNSFTLLSHNTESLLNIYYQYSKDKTMRKPAAEMRLINKNRANVLCLQETQWFRKFDATYYKDLPKAFSYPNNVTDENHSLAIYSDFPVLKSRFFATTNPINGAMYADLQLEKGIVVRVFNIHLQSNKLGGYADKIITNIDDIGEPEGRKVYKTTYRRLRDTWKIRARQVDEIADSIAHSPHPVVIAGDFNETPSSYSYQKLVSGKQDAFKVGGKWFSFTYNGSLPALSIDHIFATNDLPVLGFRVIRNSESDHFPVRAEIGY